MLTLLTFVVLLLLGLPVAFVLIASTAVFAISSGGWRLLDAVPQILFSSLEIFDLLAIPLFVLLGELMNEGGITKRIINAARAWLRWLPHSLAYVAVVTNLMLSSIMGSAIAQIAIMSRVMVPSLEKAGYEKSFSTALISAAGLLGPVIPPSMVFILYGVIGQVSIRDMFMGGILPGLLMFSLFCIVIAIRGRKYHQKTETTEPVPSLGKASLDALLTLTIPVVIVGGISFGIFTPTESAAIAIVLAIIIGSGIYRELRINMISDVLDRTAKTTATVILLVASAKIFGWVLTFNQIPQQAAEILVSISSDATIFMLLVFVFLLMVGMILDGIAALIILIPILLPIAQTNYGIDPVHFGIMACLTLSLGLLTPPVGAGLYVASSITNVGIGALSHRVLPFVGLVCCVILALILVPEITSLFN